MNKAEQYKKQNPEYEMHLVDKKFGKGNLLIKFFYRTQIKSFKQGFLAYVDIHKWVNNAHEVIEEVQNYLLETEGEIYEQDFAVIMEEDGFDCCKKYGNRHCDNHEIKFNEWYKEQFPKIDLFYGGCCHFDVALS